MSKYHVALSFAGEDREYVEKVAAELRDHGVDVFYDKFEETKLWGKNIYTYLSEIYKDKALYTVMFISEHYKEKLWTNHERESAQARAFEESKEYILPVKFDNSIEVPGILKTTGYISLKSLPPEELALKIIAKLKDDGVTISANTKDNHKISDTAEKGDEEIHPGSEPLLIFMRDPEFKKTYACHLKWDDVLEMIGPGLIKGKPEYDIYDDLKYLLSLRVFGKAKSSVKIERNSFYKVIHKFLELEFIEPISLTNVEENIMAFELTKKGVFELSRVRSIKKNDS